MSAMRSARAAALRRLLDRIGGELVLDQEGYARLARLGFSRAEVARTLDDLVGAGEVELLDKRPMIDVRRRREGA